MHFGELTYTEIRTRAEAGWLAVVPTGCTEQQGPHLPVDFDTWLAETICLAASEVAADKYGVNSMVLPALPFGPTPEHRNYGSGYIHLDQSLHEKVISSILFSLAEQGFKKIIIWRGCGQHDLDKIVENFNHSNTFDAVAAIPDWPYAAVMDKHAPDVPGGHADSFATSIALHLRPSLVREDKIPAPEAKEVEWDDPDLDFSQYSDSGVIGDATQASREMGEKLWEDVVDAAARIFRDLANREVK